MRVKMIACWALSNTDDWTHPVQTLTELLLLQRNQCRHKQTQPAKQQKYSTYVNSEIFQTFKLAQALLQLGVDLQGLDFRVFKEGPELLQSIQLACEQEAQKCMLDQVKET